MSVKNKIKALIICDGELSIKLIRKFVKLNKPHRQYIIISADGASNFLYRHKIIPDYIIGDLDSITLSAKKYFLNKKVTIKKIHNQNKNDLEKCIRFAISKHIEEIDVAGLAGKRTDHTLNNLSIIKKYSAMTAIKCYDDEFEYFFADKKTIFRCRKGDAVSLLAISRASGITTKGLKYPLKNRVLEFGGMQGALNRAEKSEIMIEVKRGNLLIFKKF